MTGGTNRWFDPGLAAGVASGIAGRWPIPGRVEEALSELLGEGLGLASGLTGLREPSGFRACVVDRAGWAREAALTLERLLDLALAKEPAPARPSVARAAASVEAGLLLGYLSRRVVAQVDPLDPEPGRVLFVYPNLRAAEDRWRAPRRELRLLVAVHEATHLLEFASAPWLSEHLAAMAAEALVLLSPRGASEALVRSLASLAREGLSGAVLEATAPLRQLLSRVQGTMGFLEGLAAFVAEEVAGSHPALAGVVRAVGREFLAAPEGVVGRVLGVGAKLAQYRAGVRFCRRVVAEAGWEGVTRALSSPRSLPGWEELVRPGLWLERVMAS